MKTRGDAKPATKQRLFSAAIASLIIVSFLPAAGLCGQIEVIDHRTQEEGLFNNTVTAVSPAGEEGVFIASEGGLHVLSDYFFLPVFQNIPAVALSQDPGGDLWAATKTGLVYRVADKDGLWSASRFALDNKHKITAISSRFGAVTIGTDSGLYYAGPDGALRTIVAKTGITALASADDGTIIAGARDRAHMKGGLLIVGGTFAEKTGWVDELSGRAVGALFIDAGRLLIGTDAGAFELSGTGLRTIDLPGASSTVTAILVYDTTTLIAAGTALYASTAGGAFESVGPVSAVGGAPSGITSLAAGPGHTVWIGTRGDGIYLVRVRP